MSINEDYSQIKKMITFVDMSELSPTARTLYWFRQYQVAVKGKGSEMSLKEAAKMSGIPESSFYRAAREIGLSIDRKGSVVNF